MINELVNNQPDVIVLAGLNYDLWDRFGLNREERLALYEYIEEGHGLILTSGSQFDMRYKTQSSDEGVYIGTYNHVNRLDLISTSNPLEIRDNYLSSIAAMAGLGLSPLYEEARDWIGDLLDSGSQTKPFAPVVWNLPLFPFGVPFNGTFKASDASDLILSGVGTDFTVSLTHPVKDPSLGSVNTTMIGWQLEYPFLMASEAINASKPYINVLKDYFRTGIKDLIQHLFDNDPVGIIPGTATFDVTAGTVDEMAENITNCLTELLNSLYQTRMNTPETIEIPLEFTIGGHNVSYTLIFTIPAELQMLLRPAVIAAKSTDNLAAVLRYEVGNHRTVTFTFDPVLGGNTCQLLLKNAINWAASVPTPISTVVIGSLNISANLVTEAQDHIYPNAQLIQTFNELVHTAEETSFDYQFNTSEGSIIIYWLDGVGTVEISKDSQQVTTQSYQEGTHFAVVSNITEAGTWTVSVTLAQEGLLNPIAIELYAVSPITTTTTISTTTSATVTSTTTTQETTSDTTTTTTTTTTSEAGGGFLLLEILFVALIGFCLHKKRKK